MSAKGTSPDFWAGADVGGTKVHIADTKNPNIARFELSDFPDMYAVLDEYFQQNAIRPAKMAVAMAGPRDDETGTITLTNSVWPTFKPSEAKKRYPGTNFITANDMIATAAGAISESGIELKQLKAGTEARKGTKLVMAISTGVGSAGVVWDRESAKYVFVESEGGHIGFQPKTEHEYQYLLYLNRKYQHASAELALSGRHGIDNLIDHSLEKKEAPDLAAAIARAREAGRPVGTVLFELAMHGGGAAKESAQTILKHMGAMIGSVMRDLAVAYKSTGGVYLTGSVALGLGEYWAENTDLINRFVREGAVHDSLLEKVPIYLVTDPHVAATGALALAKR